MKRLTLWAIKFYQVSKSFGFEKNRILKTGACRFSPTCSQYTYEAVEKYGVVKGLFMGSWRILRCHPWSAGGYEPVT